MSLAATVLYDHDQFRSAAEWSFGVHDEYENDRLSNHFKGLVWRVRAEVRFGAEAVSTVQPHWISADYSISESSGFTVSAGPMLRVWGDARTIAPLPSLFAAWHLSDAVGTEFGERLRVLAVSLGKVGLAHGIAYEGPDDEVIVEFGQAHRALTLVLQKDKTLALFRLGGTDDYSQVSCHSMESRPSPVEYERVAQNYLASYLCPANHTKRTSPLIVSSVAA